MDHQLYLLEVLIDTIYFEDNIHEIPPKKQILVNVKFGNIVNLEIRSETLPSAGEGPKRRVVDFKSGRSYLCSYSTSKLIEILNKVPLEISLHVRGDPKPIGSCSVPWEEQFKEMLNESMESKEFQSPAMTFETYPLIENATNVIKANIQAIMKLSCFGKSIQTQFEILDAKDGDNRQYLFKSFNNVTTFSCTRYGPGNSSDFIPIASIFGAATLKSECLANRPSLFQRPSSWNALLDRASVLYSKPSTMQSEFVFPADAVAQQTAIRESQLTFDIISIVAKPEEERFLNFLTGQKINDLTVDQISLDTELNHEGAITLYEDNVLSRGDEYSYLETEAAAAQNMLRTHSSPSRSAEERHVSRRHRCTCPDTPPVCNHVIAAIERFEKNHPYLTIGGKRVNYDKILRGKNRKDDKVLRLRGGSFDEKLTFVKTRKAGCYANCPLIKKLHRLGLGVFVNGGVDSMEIKREDSTVNCKDVLCRNTPVGKEIVYHYPREIESGPINFTCENMHCPAAEKFKRFGIGPLATGTGLGTLNGPVDVPVIYGLSNTYGVFDTYGPYGIFTKYFTPFIPQNQITPVYVLNVVEKPCSCGKSIKSDDITSTNAKNDELSTNGNETNTTSSKNEDIQKINETKQDERKTSIKKTNEVKKQPKNCCTCLLRLEEMSLLEKIPIDEGPLEHTQGDRPANYDNEPCAVAVCSKHFGETTCDDCKTKEKQKCGCHELKEKLRKEMRRKEAEEARRIQAGPLEQTRGDRPRKYDCAPCAIDTCFFRDGPLDCDECFDRPKDGCRCGWQPREFGRTLTGPLEYTRGDRPRVYDMAPCSTASCKGYGFDRECAQCAKRKIKPPRCNCRSQKSGPYGSDPNQGPLEHTEGNRPVVYDAAPCNEDNCQIKGGDLICNTCKIKRERKPCSGKCRCGCKNKEPLEGPLEETKGDRPSIYDNEPCSMNALKCQAKGGNLLCDSCKKCSCAEKRTSRKQEKMLRLRGGAGIDDYLLKPSEIDFIRSKLLLDRRNINTPSPWDECKDLLDEFDDVIYRYKRALGPCAKISCTHIPAFNEMYCQCENIKNDDRCNCKSLYDDYDLDVETALIGPMILRNCKVKNDRPKLNLPPIHWDCPDPLPVGPCKNRRCPFNIKKKTCFADDKQTRNVTFKKPERLRLRGGGTIKSDILTKSETEFLKKERGRIRWKEILPKDLLRLKGGAPSKSPILECREIMEQFDKILGEYRDALGPCGNVSCGQAYVLNATKCKSECAKIGRIDERIATNLRGCGSPGCQYQKYKAALMEVDANIEKQFLFSPPNMSNCGHPRCDFKAESALPPIHWECPEPLPIGPCKNPKCPHLPENLRKIAKYLPNGCGSCGHEGCAYKLPESCSSPSCPFGAIGEARQKNPFKVPMQTIVGRVETCENPNCEYKSDKNSSGECSAGNRLCSNPSCPHQPMVPAKCANPLCPSNVQQQTVNLCCSHPECPMPADSESTGPFKDASPTDSCSNPDCPFRSSDSTCDETPACGNPQCPFSEMQQEPSKESCDNYACPLRYHPPPEESRDSCDCHNPECPRVHKDCSNPTCPFNLREIDACKNPECRYRRKAADNEIPFCQSASDDTTARYCGDPGCQLAATLLEKQIAEGKTGVPGGGDSGENRVVARTEETNRRQGVVGDGNSPKNMGGDGGNFTSPSIKQKVASTESSKEPEGPLEITSGTRPSVYDRVPCKPTTCRAQGGRLVCDTCKDGGPGVRGPCPKTCPGDPLCPLSGARKPRNAPRRGEPAFRRSCVRRKRFVYHYGDKYPGLKIGHKECVMPYFMVPPRMGWLWNIHTPCMSMKPRRGWRPGAISRTVAAAIQAHRRSKNMSPLEEINKAKKRKKKFGEESETEMIAPKPTLQIKKREGTYFITMNPLKDPNTLVTNENPYMECTPMQFKITKNKDQDARTCVCNDDGEIIDSMRMSESSDSELDIEFTPPAGIIHPDRFIKRRDVIHIETQYDPRHYAAAQEKPTLARTTPPPLPEPKKSKKSNASAKKRK